ncbi:MAG TPA: translation initiation factor [Dehalococcoidia bacterium]|nr:translation initiation factor [Dehalococcoidia bacterium]
MTRERSGRGGKEVTVIHGLPGNPDEIRKLATTLKQRCGVGGTVRERTVELQGDQSTRVVAWLEKQGHRVKLAGG